MYLNYENHWVGGRCAAFKSPQWHEACRLKRCLHRLFYFDGFFFC